MRLCVVLSFTVACLTALPHGKAQSTTNVPSQATGPSPDGDVQQTTLIAQQMPDAVEFSVSPVSDVVGGSGLKPLLLNLHVKNPTKLNMTLALLIVTPRQLNEKSVELSPGARIYAPFSDIAAGGTAAASITAKDISPSSAYCLVSKFGETGPCVCVPITGMDAANEQKAKSALQLVESYRKLGKEAQAEQVKVRILRDYSKTSVAAQLRSDGAPTAPVTAAQSVAAFPLTQAAFNKMLFRFNDAEWEKHEVSVVPVALALQRLVSLLSATNGTDLPTLNGAIKQLRDAQTRIYLGEYAGHTNAKMVTNADKVASIQQAWALVGENWKAMYASVPPDESDPKYRQQVNAYRDSEAKRLEVANQAIKDSQDFISVFRGSVGTAAQSALKTGGAQLEAQQQAAAQQELQQERAAIWQARVQRAHQIFGWNGDFTYCPDCIGPQVSAIGAGVINTTRKISWKNLPPDPNCQRCGGTGLVPAQ